MKLPEIEEKMSVRAKNGLLWGHYDGQRLTDHTMRVFCDMLPNEVKKLRNVGVGTVKEYEKLLAIHDLHFGLWMDDVYDEDIIPDIDDADLEPIIEEDEPEYGKQVKSDTINWEQRRWELATALFAHYPDLTDKSALELADNFIANYKEPYKTSTLI